MALICLACISFDALRKLEMVYLSKDSHIFDRTVFDQVSNFKWIIVT